MRRIAFIVAMLACGCAAQLQPLNTIATAVTGQPGSIQLLAVLPGSTAYVCTGNSAGTPPATPCAAPGTAAIFSDIAGTVPLAQPLVADANGKLPGYAAAANYYITYTPPSGSIGAVTTINISLGPTTAQQYSVTAIAPAAPPTVSVVPVGTTGSTTYYYWVVSNFTLGNSAPSAAASLTNAAATLSGVNYDKVTWGAVTGANSYDVLRTTTATAPTGACACAVATAVSGVTQNDQSNTLSAYTVSTWAGNTTFNVTNVASAAGESKLTFAADHGTQFAVDNLHGVTITQPNISPTSIANVVIPNVTTNGKANDHGHAVASSTDFTTTDSVFASGDVGKTIVIENAGSGNKGFATTIAAYVSPTEVTLAAATPSSVTAGQTQFFWGTDDTTAVSAAITQAASIAQSKLFFEPGIYITTSTMVAQAADGLTIEGAGNGGNNQTGYGTRIVYAGTAGGAPGSGTENALLRISGTGVTVQDVALDAGGLATAALWADTTVDPIFSLHVQNVGAFAGRYWSAMWGQPDGSAFAGTFLGMASADNFLWGQSGCGVQFSNCNGTTLADGGGNLINIGNGNFNFAMSNSQGIANGVSRGFGDRSLMIYSGNKFAFDNLYLPPLGGVNQPSVDVEGGTNITFNSIYDENGYGLLSQSGSPLTVDGWLTRSTSASNAPHQAMLIPNEGRVNLRDVESDGLPVILSNGAELNCIGLCVESTLFGSDQVWSGMSAAVSAVARTGGTATLTTGTQSFATGDWVFIAGLTNTAYNGVWQLTGATSTSISFALTGTQSSTSDVGTVIVDPGLVGPTANRYITGTGPVFNANTMANGSGTDANRAAQVIATPQAMSGIAAFTPDFGGTNGEYIPSSLTAGLNLLDLRPSGTHNVPVWYYSTFGGAIGHTILGAPGVLPSDFTGTYPLEVLGTKDADSVIGQLGCGGTTCIARINFVANDQSSTVAQQVWSNDGTTKEWSISSASKQVLDASTASGTTTVTLGGTGVSVVAAGTFHLPVTIVSSLPTASGAGSGAMFIVTDAASTTIGVCTGSGSTVMIAVSDGSAWTCH